MILPSLGRSGKDYDAVSRLLAKDGFRVLRPQPRGIGRSQGPMEGLNMHDLAADVASVIEHEKAGRRSSSATPSATSSPARSRRTGPTW